MKFSMAKSQSKDSRLRLSMVLGVESAGMAVLISGRKGEGVRDSGSGCRWVKAGESADDVRDADEDDQGDDDPGRDAVWPRSRAPVDGSEELAVQEVSRPRQNDGAGHEEDAEECC